MTPRDYEFRAPEPRQKKPPAPQPEQFRPRKLPLPLLVMSIAAALVALGLVVTAAVIWGPASQPQAIGTGAGTPTPTAGGTEPGATPSTPAPTTTPEPVTPGMLVPITMNAQFTQGLTVVPPPVGDWIEFDIRNRPDQFSAHRGDYTAQIEVWQTDLFTSPQSDESLSISQLNRITDECQSNAQFDGGPALFTITGKDGTRLEFVGQRATNCDGGEILMLERLMPHTGTRIHIVIWTTIGIENDKEAMDLLPQVTFTVP